MHQVSNTIRQSSYCCVLDNGARVESACTSLSATSAMKSNEFLAILAVVLSVCRRKIF